MKRTLLISLMVMSILKIVDSRCPFVRIQQDFSPDKFSGVWYETLRSKNIDFEKYECNKAKLTMRKDGKIDVLNSEYNINKDKLYKKTAVLTLSSADGYFKYSLLGSRIDYRVLSTDYDNYAIVFSCSNSFILWKTEFVWIFSRARLVSPADLDLYLGKLTDQLSYYNYEKFHQTDQGDKCTYAA